MDKQLMASIILSGLLSNPNVLSHNHNCGWSIVNISDEQLVYYAVELSEKIKAISSDFVNIRKGDSNDIPKAGN